MATRFRYYNQAFDMAQDLDAERRKHKRRYAGKNLAVAWIQTGNGSWYSTPIQEGFGSATNDHHSEHVLLPEIDALVALRGNPKRVVVVSQTTICRWCRLDLQREYDLIKQQYKLEDLEAYELEKFNPDQQYNIDDPWSGSLFDSRDNQINDVLQVDLNR